MGWWVGGWAGGVGDGGGVWVGGWMGWLVSGRMGGGRWVGRGMGEYILWGDHLVFWLQGLYTFKYAKIRVRDAWRLFEDCRVFAHHVIKMPLRQMREDAKTFASAQLWRKYRFY